MPALGRRVETLVQIDGSMPRLDAIPAGCAFNPRCGQVMERCLRARP
ncbi:MAG: ABC transporter ATP-binding protein, partial [Roseinatronobacter sp.]